MNEKITKKIPDLTLDCFDKNRLATAARHLGLIIEKDHIETAQKLCAFYSSSMRDYTTSFEVFIKELSKPSSREYSNPFVLLQLAAMLMVNLPGDESLIMKLEAHKIGIKLLHAAIEKAEMRYKNKSTRDSWILGIHYSDAANTFYRQAKQLAHSGMTNNVREEYIELIKNAISYCEKAIAQYQNLPYAQQYLRTIELTKKQIKLMENELN